LLSFCLYKLKIKKKKINIDLAMMASQWFKEVVYNRLRISGELYEKEHNETLVNSSKLAHKPG